MLRGGPSKPKNIKNVNAYNTKTHAYKLMKFCMLKDINVVHLMIIQSLKLTLYKRVI